MTDEGIVAALAEALTAEGVRGENLAAALLPVVRHIAEQRAAEELRAAAEPIYRTASGLAVVLPGELRERAAALTATPNHGTDAT